MPRKLFRLGLDPASYNPVGLRSYSDEALRNEYSRLQQEAKSRLESLRKSEYGRSSEIYRENKGRYPALSRIEDRRQLERAVQDAARFVSSAASTASGQQEIAKRQLESLDDSGYGWLKRPMLRAWGAFMDHLRETSGREAFYSPMIEEEPVDGEPEDAEENATMDAQKRVFYEWAEENGYLSYETVTRRGKEVTREVWLK